MAPRKVILACRNYDGTNAILRGLARPTGIDLDIIETTSVQRMFLGFFKGDYDVSEMSFSELIFYTSRGTNDFVAIPVFPSRWFRHSFIVCRKDGGVRGPEDLNGKRLGFVRWVQTAAIWMRGTLMEHYGVSPEKTQWLVGSLHHWDEGSVDEVTPRNGSKIQWLQGNRKAADAQEVAFAALRNGEIDVLGTTEHPRSLMEKDPNVRRLFENYREEEAAYYKKTRILPVMHVLAVRKSALEEHPELPEKMFHLFCQARKMGRELIRSYSSNYLAWKDYYIDEEDAIFREDPLAYGLKANEHLVEKFLSYCHEQGISERRLSPQDLFHPSTWDLKEN